MDLAPVAVGMQPVVRAMLSATPSVRPSATTFQGSPYFQVPICCANLSPPFSPPVCALMQRLDWCNSASGVAHKQEEQLWVQTLKPQ